MDRLTREQFRQLLNVQAKPCVSLYLPTHVAGRETRQDPIRYKNLITEAAERLEQSDGDKSVLEGPRKLQADEDFWRHQSTGLAVFSSPEGMQTFRLPQSFDPTVVVGERFYIKPLLAVLQHDGQFYLLAASQEQVRFFAGSKHSMSRLDPAGMPKSLSDALNIDEYQESIQFHTASYQGGNPRAGRKEAIFHGHGGGTEADVKQTELLPFFQRLDNAVCDFLAEERQPLVFAGVDYLFPIYQKANHYEALIDEPVTGNPDDLSAGQLHRRAWNVIEPRFRERQQKDLNRLGTAISAGQGATDLEVILPAAAEGRVDTLFLAAGASYLGVFDSADRTVSRHEPAKHGDEDLIDRAAAETLRCDGAVYVVEPARLESSPIAAIFRY